MNGTTHRLADPSAQRHRGMNKPNDGIMGSQRNQHVADRKAAAPDRVDHRMIGAGGGVGHGNGGIGAEVPRQIEGQLHPGRQLREALIDAELEVEGAIPVPEHDCGGDRGVAGPQRHDLAFAGFGECGRGAADKAGIAVVLQQRGAALGFPAAGLEGEESLDGWRNVFGCARHIETDGAVLGQPVALAAQFFQLLRPQCVTQQFIGILRCVEAGASMGLQQFWTHAALPQDFREGFHGGAVQRDVAQDQRMGAGFARRPH